MKVSELADAMAKMVAQGHGDADVSHVNGQGKATVVCGWQLVTSAAWDQRLDRGREVVGHQLRLFTTSPF